MLRGAKKWRPFKPKPAAHRSAFRVVRAIVLVSPNGAQSPGVRVEPTKPGRCAVVLLTVGILAHQVRGSIHTPGSGSVIDWATVERRPQTRLGQTGIYQPSLLGRQVYRRFARP